MADWRKLAMNLALADGKLDEREAKIIHKALLADGVLDREEVEFMVELKAKAQAVTPAFTKFVHEVIKKVLLRDGTLSDAEAEWLRKYIFFDNKVDAAEKQLLHDLRHAAKSVSPGFLKMYDQAMKS
jgi:hypothetical protein